VDDNIPALEAAVNSCLHGNHVALQTLIDAFPSKLAAYIQQLSDEDILGAVQFNFDIVVKILMDMGWRPKSASKWLRRCTSNLMAHNDCDPWAVFVGTLAAAQAQGIFLEHPDDPLLPFVIRLLAECPPGFEDLNEAEIIKKLLDLGISVNKAAVVAATEANMWGCVGVLAEKLRAK
jgi:hypothetical protein